LDARRVQQAARRLHLARQVRAERALGVGEAAGEVDHEHRGALTEREPLAEACPLVHLARLFVAHALTACRFVSSCPNFARATKRPCPGCATSSSSSTTTAPRQSTTDGAPCTSVPSNRL